MTKEELNDFLEKKFHQVNKSFEILKVSNKNFSMLMHISSEHLRPGATVSGPTMFLLADVTFYLATLSVIGPKSLTVTTNCSINFLRKPSEKNLYSQNRILKIGKSLCVGDVLIYSVDLKDPVCLLYTSPSPRDS